MHVLVPALAGRSHGKKDECLPKGAEVLGMRLVRAPSGQSKHLDKHDAPHEEHGEPQKKECDNRRHGADSRLEKEVE